MDIGKTHVNNLILQVVENQLKDNRPAEARETFDRLTGAGFSEEETKHLIGSAIVAEMRNVVKTSKPFDAGRYIKLLEKLPDLTEEQS